MCICRLFVLVKIGLVCSSFLVIICLVWGKVFRCWLILLSWSSWLSSCCRVIWVLVWMMLIWMCWFVSLVIRLLLMFGCWLNWNVCWLIRVFWIVVLMVSGGFC